MCRPLSAAARLAALALLLAGGDGAAQPVPRDAERTRAALRELQDDIERISAEQRARLQRQDTLQSRLRAAETALGELGKEIADLERRIAAIGEEMAALRARREALERAAAAQQSAVAGEIRQSWRGDAAQLQLLLSQEDPQELARLLAYYRYVLRARRRLIDDYRDTLGELDGVERELAVRAAELEQRRGARRARRQELQQRQQQRRELLGRLEAQAQDAATRLAARQRDRRELEQLLREIEEALAAVAAGAIGEQPFSAARGQMPWPVDGRVSDRFGRPRGQGNLRWQGLRLTAPQGAVVSAIHHGRVVYADWLRGSGLLLVLDHGEGYMSLYAHNESLLREVGEAVRSGAPIATVGSSGGQDKTALYFEIRKDGRPVDPATWIAGGSSG